MKYWLDTEFIERPYTIDLISVGLVAEDGREFYAESSEVDWTKASEWTLHTVRPQLNGSGMVREEIGYAVRRFVDADAHPVFWGYFPAYDWVSFLARRARLHHDARRKDLRRHTHPTSVATEPIRRPLCRGGEFEFVIRGAGRSTDE